VLTPRLHADLHLTLVWPLATVYVLSDSSDADDSRQSAELVNSGKDSYSIVVVLLYYNFRVLCVSNALMSEL
jgi:hypothetical protein